MKKVTFITILTILIISNNILLAECPPTGSGNWTDQLSTLHFEDNTGGTFSENATVNFQHRSVGTTGGQQIQLKIDWSTLNNGVNINEKTGFGSNIIIY